jgi:hypothetical protein
VAHHHTPLFQISRRQDGHLWKQATFWHLTMYRNLSRSLQPLLRHQHLLGVLAGKRFRKPVDGDNQSNSKNALN